jgi:putative transposase
MRSGPIKHNRNSIRLKGYDYDSAGGYYLTLVTLHRECLFGQIEDGRILTNGLGKIVQECWDEIPAHFQHVSVDVFVVMPNHIHGIVFIHEKDNISTSCGGAIHCPGVFAGHRPDVLTGHSTPAMTHQSFGKPIRGSLPTIVRTFKAAVTRRAGREMNLASLWQRNFYEHIIRNKLDYERIAGYIASNPANWTDDEENPNKIPGS